MKITLDLDRLRAEGRVTPEEAMRLAALAEGHEPDAAGRGRTVANVVMIFGALSVAVAVTLLNPTAAVGGALAAAALVAAALLMTRRDEAWTLLAHALVIGGALGAVASFVSAYPTMQATPLVAGLFLAATALAFRSRVVAGFAPLGVGSWIGAGAGYWSATYALVIQHPLVTIVVFSAMAAALFAVRGRLPKREGVLTVMARVSVFLANFGFWVGSLAGDPLKWGKAADNYTGNPVLPPWLFAAAWAASLLAVLAWGLKRERRFLSNTAVTFLGIDFYTQIFERFGHHAWVVLVCGLLLVAFAVGFVRFDAWQKARRTPPASA